MSKAKLQTSCHRSPPSDHHGCLLTHLAFSGPFCLPSVSLVRKVRNKLWIAPGTSLFLVASFWPHRDWFPSLLQSSVGSSRLLPHCVGLLRQPHVHGSLRPLHALPLTACRTSGALPLVRFSSRVAKFLAGSSQPSTIVLYQYSGRSTGSGVRVRATLLHNF